jgi:hypothetical protein
MASPLQEFGRIAQKLSRNPLGIIALFIVSVYGIAGLVLGASSRNLEHSERLPLVWFLKSADELKQIQAMIIRGVVRGWEYAFNFRLASGHVLENTLTQQELYNQVMTTGIDWREALQTHPRREISQAEYEAVRSSKQFLTSPSPVNLSKVKRFIRLVATQRPKES